MVRNSSDGSPRVISLNPLPAIRRDPEERRRAVWALSIVLASALGNTVIALSGGLYADDLRESSRAAVDPWSIDWILGWETYRHLAPWERAHFSLFVTIAPLNHPFAAALMAVELSIALGLFYLLARRVIDPRWSLVALLLAASTPLLTATHAWLIQGVSLYGVMIGLHMAALGLLGYVDDGRHRWLVLAAFGWLIGAGTWETWLAGPPALFLLMVVLQDRGSIESRLTDTVRIAWPFWLLTAGIVGVFLSLWWLGDYGTGAELPSGLAAIDALWEFLTFLVVPGMLGGPWDWFAGANAYSPIAAPGTGLVVLAAVAFTALASWAVSHERRETLRGLTIVIGVVSLTVALPILGRLTQFPGAVPREPRYVAPALTLVALGLILILRALSEVRWTSRLRRLAAGAVVLVFLGIAVSDTNFVRIWSRNPSSDYISAGRGALESADPDAGIFNTRVPESVLSSAWFPSYANTLEIFRPVLRDDVARFGTGQSRLMFDESGMLVPARFYPLTWAEIAPCRPIQRGQSATIALKQSQIHEKDLTLRVEVFAQQNGTLLIDPVSSGSQDNPRPPLEMSLKPGVNDAYFLLPRASVAEVRLSSPSTFTCVESLVVGQPAP